MIRPLFRYVVSFTKFLRFCERQYSSEDVVTGRSRTQSGEGWAGVASARSAGMLWGREKRVDGSGGVGS
jgi:hypothetical protein